MKCIAQLSPMRTVILWSMLYTQSGRSL